MDLDDYLLHIAKNFYVVHELCYELITNHKNLAFILMQVFWPCGITDVQRVGVFSKVTADFSNVTELRWDWIKRVLWSLLFWPNAIA